MSFSHCCTVLVTWQPSSRLGFTKTVIQFFFVCYSIVIRFKNEEQSNNNIRTIE